MDSVAVLGGTVLDVNFELPKLFLHRYLERSQIELPFGDKLLATRHDFMLGGSGANVAVGLKKLGLTTWFRTAVSRDGIGAFLRSQLEDHNLDLSLVEYDQPSAISTILRVAGERTIITGGPSSLELLEVDWPKHNWLHLGPIHGECEEFCLELSSQRQKSVGLSLNPSMDAICARSRGFLSLLRQATILFINKAEALALTRLDRSVLPEQLVSALKRLGPEIACLTCGESGAYVAANNQVLSAQALVDKGNLVDATGAGDAFTSGFLGGYLLSKNLNQDDRLRKALQFATANSGSVVVAIGAQAGLLDAQIAEKDGQSVKIRQIGHD